MPWLVRGRKATPLLVPMPGTVSGFEADRLLISESIMRGGVCDQTGANYDCMGQKMRKLSEQAADEDCEKKADRKEGSGGPAKKNRQPASSPGSRTAPQRILTGRATKLCNHVAGLIFAGE